MTRWIKSTKTREEKVKDALDRLDAGVVGFFQSDSFQQYLKVMGQFHRYSVNNMVLIAMQKPEASLVAGYHDWQRKFNRQVRQGEKGIMILAPIIKKREELTGRLDPDGIPEVEEVSRIVTFAPAYVFDIAQTEGEPLPDMGIRKLNAEVTDFEKIRDILIEIAGCPVSFVDIPGEANGLYNRGDHSIQIQKGMPSAQTIKTLLHEITHSRLHRELNEDKSSEEKEIEAESTAFIVCDYLGIDGASYSFGYVATWSQGKKPSELKDCLSEIRKAANELIEELDKRLGIVQSPEQQKETHSAEAGKESYTRSNDNYAAVMEQPPLFLYKHENNVIRQGR